MKLTVTCVAVCCGLVLFTSCKKKEDNLSEREKLLEAGKWQMSAYTATTTYMGKDTTTDLYSQMAECDKDDFMLFAKDGSSTMDENANKCANDDQIEHAKWALLNSDAKLALVDSNPDTFDLDLTSTQMKLSKTKPNSSGTPVLYLFTFKNIR